MTRPFTSARIHPGFGRYHQAVEVPAGARLLLLSGLLGIRPDGTIPDGIEAQASIILDGIDACLDEAHMERRHLVHLRTYLVEPGDRAAFMRLRDAYVVDPAPCSTLLFVKALAQPVFRIEIEATAAA